MKVVAKLEKPYSNDERANFIIKYNHNNGYFIEETDTEIQALGYTDEESAQLRKDLFYSQFMKTSLGNYRLKPKAYSNAQQSIDTVNNMVNIFGSLTSDIANILTFYQTPDFAKEEECTEEWLVEHQIHPNAMSKEEWSAFYIEFSTTYASQQHRS